MKRAPEPIHWWLVAFGKTVEWLLAYVKTHAPPGEAASGEVTITSKEDRSG